MNNYEFQVKVSHPAETLLFYIFSVSIAAITIKSIVLCVEQQRIREYNNKMLKHEREKFLFDFKSYVFNGIEMLNECK